MGDGVCRGLAAAHREKGAGRGRAPSPSTEGLMRSQCHWGRKRKPLCPGEGAHTTAGEAGVPRRPHPRCRNAAARVP